jgi:hypothetical protein
MLKFAIAGFLFSGFHTYAQSHAGKRVVVQCAGLVTSCQKDIGYLDRKGRFHPVNKKAGHAIR